MLRIYVFCCSSKKYTFWTLLQRCVIFVFLSRLFVLNFVPGMMCVSSIDYVFWTLHQRSVLPLHQIHSCVSFMEVRVSNFAPDMCVCVILYNVNIFLYFLKAWRRCKGRVLCKVREQISSKVLWGNFFRINIYIYIYV